MIGIVIEVALSWVVLRFLARKNLKVLGLTPTKKSLAEFGLGLLVASTMCLLYYQLTAIASGSYWTLNESYSFNAFIQSFWYVTKSVLFEEFIFRGAILYVLISRIGAKKACWISAISFGVYHWFSYGIIGNLQPMIFVFLLTATWGLMFAYAYAKTESMLLPIALHFGWNAVNLIVFSQGNIGDQLLVGVGGKPLDGMVSLAMFILQWLGLPVIVFLYLKFNHSTNKVEKAVKDDKA
ncbi:type II CAAX endopeptidase family protein [Ekhidna sp. MALMAid0563]|uniref:CPBP family intramembrane glutamic endopeptidase n=1 Tax=Ekhidna sp. MALMAid0563 TaxID=3143937 RepID=UPI0032DE86EE